MQLINPDLVEEFFGDGTLEEQDYAVTLTEVKIPRSKTYLSLSYYIGSKNFEVYFEKDFADRDPYIFSNLSQAEAVDLFNQYYEEYFK